MTILFAYDGSESADAAIAAAGQLLGDVDATADVVTVWEPLTVEALRAARFGGSPPIPPGVADVDRRAAGEMARLRCRTPESSRPAFGGQPNVELLPRRAVRVPKATS